MSAPARGYRSPMDPEHWLAPGERAAALEFVVCANQRVRRDERCRCKLAQRRPGWAGEPVWIKCRRCGQFNLVAGSGAAIRPRPDAPLVPCGDPACARGGGVLGQRRDPWRGDPLWIKCRSCRQFNRLGPEGARIVGAPGEDR